MKTFKYWNTFAIGLPIILLILSAFYRKAYSMVAVSFMLTGLIQVIIGFRLLYNNPNNKSLRIYATTVILFFLTWKINAILNYINLITYTLIPIPFILLIYLTIIIYTIKK